MSLCKNPSVPELPVPAAVEIPSTPVGVAYSYPVPGYPGTKFESRSYIHFAAQLVAKVYHVQPVATTQRRPKPSEIEVDF